jgi:hypothetical protein
VRHHFFISNQAVILMKTFESYFLAINKWLLIVILAVMSLIIFTNVVLRYTTNISLEWAEEVARHLMIWLTFLGCGPVLRYGGHIAVENLQDAVPRGVAIAIRAIIALLVIGLFAFFTWYGLEYMDRTQYQQTPATQISIAIIYAGLPIGAAMTLIHWLLIVKDYVLTRSFPSDAHFDATASASL